MAVAGRVLASILSLPLRPLTVRPSVVSAPAIVICAGRPVTVITPAIAVMPMVFEAELALAVTASKAASPTPGIPAAEKSIATCFRSVPVRSPRVMVSDPPRACSSRRSTSFMSMTMLAMLRVSCTRPAAPKISKTSLILAPLKWTVSAPLPPSTTSLPSPGSQMKTSLPPAMRAMSLP